MYGFSQYHECHVFRNSSLEARTRLYDRVNLYLCKLSIGNVSRVWNMFVVCAKYGRFAGSQGAAAAAATENHSEMRQ